MKYISLDLETTGVEPGLDQPIMLSMVVEDTTKDIPLQELPHYTVFLKHKRISGNAYALGMNGWILDIISGRKPNETGYPVMPFEYLTLGEHMAFVGEDCQLVSADTEVSPDLRWTPSIFSFLREHFGNDRINVAGKNVAGFDMPFLPKELRSRFRHRVIDPAGIYVNFETDKAMPDLATCMKRAGIEGLVPHDAREDALIVIDLIREATR